MEKEVADLIRALEALCWQPGYNFERDEEVQMLIATAPGGVEPMFKIFPWGFYLLTLALTPTHHQAVHSIRILDADLVAWAQAHYQRVLGPWSRRQVAIVLARNFPPPLDLVEPPVNLSGEIALPLTLLKDLLVSWTAIHEEAKQSFAQLLDRSHVSPLVRTHLLDLITKDS